MSQTVITQAFEALKAQEAANGGVLTLDEFVFASVPNLNITDPIDRTEGLPPEAQIVHRQAVSKTGMVNSNAVVYSVVLGADVGDFEFNWVGLLNKASGAVAMIVHAPSQKKIKTASGQQGNVLTRSFLMEYNGASQQTQIITPADTWQIDFTARLNGVDERIRQENRDVYGQASFMDDGFLVSGANGNYLVKKGVAYIEGLRAELLFDQAMAVAVRPSRIWVDVCWRGTLTSVWAPVTKLTVADSLVNYVTGDEQHYVFAIAEVMADGSVIDLRQTTPLAQMAGLSATPDTILYFDKNAKLKKSPLSDFVRETLGIADAPGVLAQLGLTEAAALPAKLLSKRVYAIDFGNVPDGRDAAKETTTIQKAIDYVYANGGGVVDLGPFQWKVSASRLNETYDNYGVPVSASTGCIILRKGVSLVGQYGITKIYSDNPTLTLIYLVAPDGNVVSGFELAGAWSQGMQGAGHGIFQVGTQGGADISCKSTILKHLYIHNVGSYGIGLQNGNPEDCHINHIRTDTTGADGLDLKARDDLAIPPVANTVSYVWVKRPNLRLDGSAGVDIRGVWQASNITVTDFGGDATKSYTGIRFRTKPAVTDPYNKAAARSTLTGFNIMPTPGAAALLISGVECGSDDVHISNGTVEDCHVGVAHNGNEVGSAQRCSVTGVTSINARQYGFRNSVGCDDITYVGCKDIGSVAAGFRIEGANCTAVGCSGTLSVGTAASATFIQTGGRHGAGYVVTERLTDAAVAVSAKGTAADISLRLSAKGNSFIGVNADIRPDTASMRYLGTNNLPWAGGFTQTALTVLSDADYKSEPVMMSDAMLDAAEEVELVQYQYLDRIEAKGVDGARWHFGAIAQRYVEAFERHGLDATRFGFLCHDEWEHVPAIIDEETGEEISPAIEAGARYGIRYEEALVLEAAVQRRRYRRVLDRLDQALDRLDILEGGNHD